MFAHLLVLDVVAIGSASAALASIYCSETSVGLSVSPVELWGNP